MIKRICSEARKELATKIKESPCEARKSFRQNYKLALSKAVKRFRRS